MRPLLASTFWIAWLACVTNLSFAAAPPGIEKTCFECHDKETAKGDIDLSALPFNPGERMNRERWAHVYDVITKGEMPPKLAGSSPGTKATGLCKPRLLP